MASGYRVVSADSLSLRLPCKSDYAYISFFLLTFFFPFFYGQIQASIAQTLRRQSEALGSRKRTTAKATGPPFTRRSQGSYRRGRRNHRAADPQGSEDDEDANGNDGGKDSSSTDDQSAEVLKPKRSRRWGGVRFSQPSSGAANADGGGDENDSEPNRDAMGASAGLVGNSEILAWGKGGMRSHTRYGSVSGGNGKNARSSRLSKLVDYLRNLEQNDNEVGNDNIVQFFGCDLMGSTPLS